MELISGLSSVARYRLRDALEAWQACEGLSLAIRIRQAVGSQGFNWTPTQWVEWINNHSAVRLQVNRLTALEGGPIEVGRMLAEMDAHALLFSSWSQIKGLVKQIHRHQLAHLRPPERRIYNAVVKQLREISYNPVLPLEYTSSWTSSVGTSPLWAASLSSQR